jgi:hypothetical protein
MYQPKAIEPQIVKKSFNGKEKECVMIEIEGEEYELCEKISSGDNFWGNSKPGVYGAGLGRTADDKFKPARTGILGQMAFAKLTNEPLDDVYRKYGDKQDNLLGKYKVDVKCAMRDSGKSLIYHTNELGKKIPLDKDIYVCGYVESEDRANKKAKIVMVGFALKKDVANSKVEPGKKGGHLNYVVPFETMKPILGFLKAKKETLDKGKKV